MDANHYAELIKQHTAGDSVRSASMHHTLRNSEAVILLINYKKGKGVKPDQAEYQDLQKGVMAIKKYLELLKEFPDFAEKEIHSKEGYFPGVWQKLGQSEAIIDAYEVALRSESK